MTRSWATPEFVAGSCDVACKQLGQCVHRRSSKSHTMVPPWMLLIVSDPFQKNSGAMSRLVCTLVSLYLYQALSSPRHGSGLGTMKFLPNDHVKNVLYEFICVATFTCTLNLHKCGMATVNRGH